MSHSWRDEGKTETRFHYSPDLSGSVTVTRPGVEPFEVDAGALVRFVADAIPDALDSLDVLAALAQRGLWQRVRGCPDCPACWIDDSGASRPECQLDHARRNVADSGEEVEGLLRPPSWCPLRRGPTALLLLEAGR